MQRGGKSAYSLSARGQRGGAVIRRSRAQCAVHRLFQIKPEALDTHQRARQSKHRPNCRTSDGEASGNRVHDNRPRSRSGGPDDERSEILFDPSERASIGLLRLLDGVEDAYGRNRIVWRIDHVVSHEAGDTADNRNSALDAPREFVRLSRLRLHLANCSVHDALPSIARPHPGEGKLTPIFPDVYVPNVTVGAADAREPSGDVAGGARILVGEYRDRCHRDGLGHGRRQEWQDIR
jgi:hypothetical protein